MSVTRIQYVTALARALDDIGAYPISAAAANSVTAPLLIDTTSNASVSRYNGRWAYAKAQQRVVKTGGLTPSTGGLGIRPNWASNPTSSDTLYLTSLFPIISEVPGEDTSYADLISRALPHLLVVDRVTVPITTAQTYSTTTWPWLDRPERLLRVLEPGPTGGPPIDARWRGWRLRLDAESPVVELDVAFGTATGNLTLEVLRPANTWIKVSGVWTETSPAGGMTSDTDEALATVDDVITAGLVEAYRALMSKSSGRPNGNWSGKYKDALADAHRLRYYDRTMEVPQQPAAPTAAEAA